MLSLALPEALGAFLPVFPWVEGNVLCSPHTADGRGMALTQGPAVRPGGDGSAMALPTQHGFGK